MKYWWKQQKSFKKKLKKKKKNKVQYKGCVLLVWLQCWSLFIWLHRAGHFSSSTSVLNTAFVPIWASKQRWSLCSRVWETSSKLKFKVSLCPHRHFLRRQIQEQSKWRQHFETPSGKVNKLVQPQTQKFSLSLLCHTKLNLFGPKIKIRFKGLLHRSDMQ